MPIIEDTPTTPVVERNNPVEVARPAFRGVTVDTAYVPATSLLTHIEGAAWTVNYYSQVLDKDNALSGQSQDRNAAYQQYRLIQGLVLKVTTPLNQAQDTTNKDFKVTGQANVFPCGLTPNEGDMFIADGGDGRELVFTVTSTEKRSIYKDGAFIIDYEVVDYSDSRIDDLNSKVVENLYYEADFLLHGQNPLISFETRNLSNQLQGLYEEILTFYFKRFCSERYRTLVLPGQEYPIYDPYLTNAVLKMFRSENVEELKYIRPLNVNQDDCYDIPTVWTLLETKRRSIMRGILKHTGVVNAKAFSRDPTYNSIRYSGMAYVVYPTDGYLSEDTQYRNRRIPLAPIEVKKTKTQLTNLADLITEVQLNGLTHADIPVIHPIADSYVFSPAFYANGAGQSLLELLVQNYVDMKQYDLTAINKLATTYTSWSPMDQFYQLPFLLAIMRSAMRRM